MPVPTYTSIRQYFGGGGVTLVSAPATRQIHPMEASKYEFQVDFAGNYDVRLPPDVRWRPTGDFRTLVVCAGTSNASGQVRIQTFSGSTLATLTRGQAGLVILTDNTTAEGSWRILARAIGTTARLT